MTAAVQPELPFTGPLVSFVLTPDQCDRLFPLVRQQVTDRRGLLFVSIAPFIAVDLDGTQLRLQAVWLPWKTVNKVLRLIKAST